LFIHGNVFAFPITFAMNPYLSVIVPAYNEEKRIEPTLVKISDYLNNQNFDSEIVVVLDGSKDNTGKVVNDFARNKEHIVIIDRKKNRGKGYTVKEGMLRAMGKVRLFMDADNSTDIAHFDKMKPLFDSGYDVVICSRDSKDAKGAKQATPQPILKRFVGNLGNLYIQFVAVPGIWDTQCGFKALSDEAAKKIFSISLIDRWGFDIEMLALARKFSYRIGIVPAYWINDASSHVTMLGYINVLKEALQVRWNMISGKYKKSYESHTNSARGNEIN
jgi:dolichyl-phosphate beta-glucosyltransferase